MSFIKPLIEVNETNLQILQEYCKIVPEIKIVIAENFGEKYFEINDGVFVIEAVEMTMGNPTSPEYDWLLMSVEHIPGTFHNPPDTNEVEILFSENIHKIAETLMNEVVKNHVTTTLYKLLDDDRLYDDQAPGEDPHRLEEGPL